MTTTNETVLRTQWLENQLSAKHYAEETQTGIHRAIADHFGRLCGLRREAGNLPDEAGTLRVPRVIQAALDSSFPGFQHWQASDYHEGLRVGTPPAGHHGVIAPYALVLDLNADGRDDLVLDGYDQHTALLLCVISSKAGYSVQVLNQGTPIPVPAARESWKDGRRGVGLNKVLSMPPANRKDWVFVINYLPETWMHHLPPAAEDYAEGVGVMFTHGHCAVDDRDVEPDVH